MDNISLSYRIAVYSYGLFIPPQYERYKKITEKKEKRIQPIKPTDKINPPRDCTKKTIDFYA